MTAGVGTRRSAGALAACFLVLVLPVRVAPALGPHELLLLVNETSPHSILVAEEFAALRGVPPINIVRLRLPVGVPDAPLDITPLQFTDLIWTPATRAARERGIGDRILAWVYSVDFPVLVTGGPALSITGITFLRNRPADAGQVRHGTYASPVFAGPNSRGGQGHYSQSFDTLSEWLGGDMPLPSMMLGYIGEHGNTTEEVLACLQRGAQSDHTMPSGTVYFVTSDDVRSTCRQWQFPLARRQLRAMGVASVITGEFPVGRSDILGLQMGAASVRPERNQRYLPGCMAEHLTSAAAVFDSKHQTKLCAWIRAGATASAGTVAEPYSIWSKFPNARFFVHYAAGCTMIESFYQSIRCPLQVLLVGDPLAQPWAPAGRIAVDGLGQEVAGEVVIRARVQAAPGEHYGNYAFLVDGVQVHKGEGVLALGVGELAGGSHTLRVVAYRTGMVRSQVFAERRMAVADP